MAAHGVLVMERRMGVEQVGTYQKKHKERLRQHGEGRTDWIRWQISEFGERRIKTRRKAGVELLFKTEIHLNWFYCFTNLLL